VEQELIALTQRLLDAIAAGDWATYEELCAPDLTCFEPEAQGQLVSGLAFHRFYFEKGGSSGRVQTILCSPHVRMLGPDAAIVAYARVVQVETAAGFSSRAFEETRVWQRIDGAWRHIHFHRSPVTG